MAQRELDLSPSRCDQNRVNRFGACPDDLRGVVGQDVPRVHQADAPPLALHERDAEALLEHAHGALDRGNAVPKRFGRLPEMFGARKLEKDLEFVKADVLLVK